MNWNSLRPWLGTVVRLVLGVVWLWAALAKLHDPRAFVQAVRAYDATPEWLSKAIGYGLPVLEVCLGVLLVVGVAVRIAAAVSAVLFLVFLIGLIQAAARASSSSAAASAAAARPPARRTTRSTSCATSGCWSSLRSSWCGALTRLSIEEFLARNDYVEPPSAKRMRTRQAGSASTTRWWRRGARQARERATATSTARWRIVVVLVAVIGIGVQAGRAKIAGDADGDQRDASRTVSSTARRRRRPSTSTRTSSARTAWTSSDGRHRRSTADVAAEQGAGALPHAGVPRRQFQRQPVLSRAANAALCASDVSVGRVREVPRHPVHSQRCSRRRARSGRTEHRAHHVRPAGRADA